MKLYLSKKMPDGLFGPIEKLCFEHHVGCHPMTASSSMSGDDIVICDETDPWLKIKNVALLIVMTDRLPEKLASSKSLPLFYPKRALQAFRFVKQIEKLVANQWTIHSHVQEIHSRIQEVIHDLQEQLRIVRILFRNVLRKSFPRHDYVEASYQYMDQPASKLIHYSDYFGDASSRKLWVLGCTTQNYSQSADLIELIQELSPHPGEMAVVDFMHLWEKKLGQVGSYQPKEVRWAWAYFDFQEAAVKLHANQENDGWGWVYGPRGVQVLRYAPSQRTVSYPLTHEQVVFWVMGFMGSRQQQTLKDIERMYSALDLSPTTALSHLHDQFLQYCNDHQLLASGGPSMVFRLRPNTFRVVA